jgi:hypothetical protein
MKKITIFVLGIILMVGCKTEAPKNEKVQSNQNADVQNNKSVSIDYSVNPQTVKANESAEMTFTVKSSAGEIVKDFEVVHEKLIHLIVVSEDLKEFYHIHPAQQTDGSFRGSFTFPNGGTYSIYADVKPKEGSQMVKDFKQIVAGNERTKEPLKVDGKFEKNVEGLRVEMKPNSTLESGKEILLDFNVFDAETNKPVTDLEKYLGEYAHFVVISEDLSQYVHVHPMSKDDAKSAENSHEDMETHEHGEKVSDVKSEAIVSAHIVFPNAGKFIIWAQFQRNGKVINVPFVVEVK